jgi:hypothetical protein
VKARDNPFATDRVLKVRYRLHGITWDALMRKVADMGYRAAIVGPEGSGKTTLLEDLEPRLGAAGFSVHLLRLDAATRAFPRAFLDGFLPTLSQRDIILLDGADLMSRLAWYRFRRRAERAGGLVIASHKAGLLPTLIACQTTPELLDEILEEILGGGARELRDSSRQLFRKHRGNLRGVLRELYDVCAAQDGFTQRQQR